MRYLRGSLPDRRVVKASSGLDRHTLCFDAGDRLLAVRRVNIGDDGPRALARQRFRARRSDTRRSTRDDCDFVSHLPQLDLSKVSARTCLIWSEASATRSRSLRA